ncbi:hypothetical protein Acr_22g0009800 [Actinidia rufa]|uniref:Uncharacterized protein n=1 Tax=Actinidia rufa TaxID=165716 RepID=A0A7J0GLE1_9ERIC|nr:hypothetical protein Acr_22g0009800 [Actinidia rufa]
MALAAKVVLAHNLAHKSPSFQLHLALRVSRRSTPEGTRPGGTLRLLEITDLLSIWLLASVLSDATCFPFGPPQGMSVHRDASTVLSLDRLLLSSCLDVPAAVSDSHRLLLLDPSPAQGLRPSLLNSDSLAREGKALLPPPSCIDNSSALLSTFEHGLSSESELKLSVLMLAKVVERLLILEIQRTDMLQTCFTSLMEASVSLKEAQGEKEESGDDQDASDKETDEEEEVWLLKAWMMTNVKKLKKNSWIGVPK